MRFRYKRSRLYYHGCCCDKVQICLQPSSFRLRNWVWKLPLQSQAASPHPVRVLRSTLGRDPRSQEWSGWEKQQKMMPWSNTLGEIRSEFPEFPKNRMSAAKRKSSMYTIPRWVSLLRFRLITLSIPNDIVACENAFCDSHNALIAHFHDEIVNACTVAAQSAIGVRTHRWRVYALFAIGKVPSEHHSYVIGVTICFNLL